MASAFKQNRGPPFLLATSACAVTLTLIFEARCLFAAWNKKGESQGVKLSRQN
jgi:hypothetical protein